jgi:hypothetical protein
MYRQRLTFGSHTVSKRGGAGVHVAQVTELWSGGRVGWRVGMRHGDSFSIAKGGVFVLGRTTNSCCSSSVCEGSSGLMCRVAVEAMSACPVGGRGMEEGVGSSGLVGVELLMAGSRVAVADGLVGSVV